MIKKSSTVRKHIAKQRKQTSLDCFMQQMCKSNPPSAAPQAPAPPSLELICLSQLSKASSRDEFPICTPQCDTFSLGWGQDPSGEGDGQVLRKTSSV